MHDENLLRRAFGSFMTGVTIVTATDTDNTPVGFTANSFTSVSMDPPLLLVCPGKHITFYELFNTTTHFAVSILAEGQEAISNNFASGPDDRFEQVSWHRDNFGSPIIDNVCASFSCRVHHRFEAGDHMVLVGEILEFEQFERPGLGYNGNGYFSLSKEQQADTTSDSSVNGVTGMIVRFEDQILVMDSDDGLTLPTIQQQGRRGARSAMQRHIKDLGLDITLGPVYSIYDNNNNNNNHYTFFLANATSDAAKNTGRFIPVQQLDSNAFADKAQATMMSRFKTEIRNKVFGLYIGDVEAGDVHHSDNQQ
jgi:flavin reductase (DIM6/NTAB) family NADH-FMN oxidoreductase RutF